MRVDTKPFDDIRVRKAMNMALDRELIAQTHYGGNVEGTPVSMTSEALTGYCPLYEDWPEDIKAGYVYDPEGAKALLAEAGYPNGFKTNVVISSSGDLDLCQIMQAMFKDIGVDMEINVMEGTVFSDYVYRNKKHDQMSWEWFAWMSSPMRPFMLYHSINMYNTQMINDPVYDEMYEKALWTPDEPVISPAEYENRLMENVKALNMHVMSNYWFVSAPPSITYTFWQPWLKGYSGEGGRTTLSWSRVWIDQAVKSEILGQ